MLESQNVKEQFVIGTSATFDFGVRFFSPNDISCYEYNPNTKTEVLLSSGTDYTIEEKTDYSSGARVTLLGTLNTGNVLTIVRTALPVQDVSLPNFGKIPSESLETQLDRETAVTQQLHDTVQLTYRMPYGASGTQTPEQYMSDFISRMIPSSGGGGGGGGGSSYNFNSSEFNVTSGGSVSINQIDKSKITGLSSALNEKQDKLVSTTTYNINVSKAAKADSATYTGPFALSGSNTVYGIYYNVNGGNVYFGGSSCSISSSTGGSTPLSNGATLYLHFYSSAGGLDYEYTSSVPSSIPDNNYYTAIAGNSGGKVVQFQYGNIFLPGASSGGGGGSMTIPNYASIDYGNSYYSEGHILSAGSRYQTTEEGYLRLSLHVFGSATGCFGVTIGGGHINLMQLNGAGTPGMTWILPVSSGAIISCSTPPTNTSLLMMYDGGTTLLDD